MALVAIDKVKIHANRRPLKDQKVAELMQSIQANGLLNPITLDQQLNLIAGLHRLTACRMLGFENIECSIISCQTPDTARLAEIDENLIRNELEALERAEMWLERDRILERMGLRAKSGDNQYTQRGEKERERKGNKKEDKKGDKKEDRKGNVKVESGDEIPRGGEMISPPVKTTLELAREAGYTERTFQLGKQIASQIEPEVKQQIRGTDVAKSPSALLKVARAGSEARKQAEQAEQEAQQLQDQAEKAEKARLAQEARAKQKELQILALNGVTATKAAKQATKPTRSPQDKPSPAATESPNSQPGDEWMLDQHLLYCGDTTTADFIDLLPSDAALAIAFLALPWQFNYLSSEAKVTAVICPQGQVHYFCREHQLPFQYEWLVDDLYIAICSHQKLLPPDKPESLGGIEGIVAYLISLYTQPGNFVIAPLLGHGEVLIACERLGRICFAGDASAERVNRAIERWQKWSGKAAERFEA
jgi:ParB family chromosome partitioning protein